MPRVKRVNNSSLPKAQIKTGRHKRGIVEPVARVVKANTPCRELQRPEVEVMADFIRMVEKELQIQLV